MSAPQPPAPNERSKEPATEISIFVSAATAIVGTLVAFGIGINEAQGKELVGLIITLAAAAPIVAGMWTRQRVYSPATVHQLVHSEGAQFAPLLSRKAKYTAVILGAFVAALGVEIWFAADKDAETPTLTDLITSVSPFEVTAGVVGGLAVWLLIHFWERRDRRKTVGAATQP